MNANQQPFPIEINPREMGGVPTIGSLRLPVEYLFRHGVNEFKLGYPDVTDEEIEAVIDATVGLLEEHCRQLNAERDIVRPANTEQQPFPIQTNPRKMGGVPTIGDQRLPVEYLFGHGVKEFKIGYPQVADEDIENVINATIGLLGEHCRKLNIERDQTAQSPLHRQPSTQSIAMAR